MSHVQPGAAAALCAGCRHPGRLHGAAGCTVGGGSCGCLDSPPKVIPPPTPMEVRRAPAAPPARPAPAPAAPPARAAAARQAVVPAAAPKPRPAGRAETGVTRIRPGHATTPPVAALRRRLGELATEVTAIRTRSRVSQKRLAASAGLVQSYVSHIESGKRRCTVEALALLADALGFDVDIRLIQREITP